MALIVFAAGTTQPTHESADPLMVSSFFALLNLESVSLHQKVFLHSEPPLAPLFVFVRAVEVVDASIIRTVVIWTTPAATEFIGPVMLVENFTIGLAAKGHQPQNISDLRCPSAVDCVYLMRLSATRQGTANPKHNKTLSLSRIGITKLTQSYWCSERPAGHSRHT